MTKCDETASQLSPSGCQAQHNPPSVTGRKKKSGVSPFTFLPQAFGATVVVEREMLFKVTLLLVAIATGVSARRSMQAAHGLPQWQPCMAHSPSVQKLCLSPSAGQPNVTWDNSSGTLTCQVPPYGSQFRFRPACVGMCLYVSVPVRPEYIVGLRLLCL